MKPNPKVDGYFTKTKKWPEEQAKLRTIVLSCDVTEELKWQCPCYTVDGGNVVLIHAFKDYCALLFFKGALMKDPKKILIQQTKNVQSSRQIRFTSMSEIRRMEPVIKAYIKEGIRVEKAGLKVELKKTEEFPMAEEFRQRLDEMPRLRDAFEALTPGRQRGYLLHFSSAKQPKTREARVEKYVDRILDGLGLDD